jgi:predicted  nucleic acid-binding Zn-ribbon protein
MSMEERCKYCGQEKPKGRKPVKFGCLYCGAKVAKEFMENQAKALYGSLAVFEKQMFLRTLGRNFINAMKTRIACQSRINKFEEYLSPDELEVLKDIRDLAEATENDIVTKIKEQTKGHLLWQMAENVKGLGDRGVITFLSYIDPYKADTGGKAKAYLGLAPNKGRQKGQDHNVNFQAKGRFFGVVLNGVIMAKDPLYYDHYLKSKEHYSQVPKYAEEQKRFIEGSKAKITKGMRHIDRLAKRNTLALIVSHGTQVMRMNEGLDVSAFESHRGYIPPPLKELSG